MRRRLALVLWSVLTVVGLACAGWVLVPADSRGPDGPREPPNPTTSGPVLYRKVLAAMTAEETATYTFSGSTGGGEILSGTGALRFLPGAGLVRAFDGDVTITSPTTGRTRAVLLPDALYLALPPLKGLPPNKPWLRVSEQPKTELGRRLGPLAEEMRSAFDPGRTLGLLGAADTVEEIGPATAEGEPVTAHVATVDLRRAARLAADPALREQYRVMTAAGVTVLRLDLFLDDMGLPRRVHAEVPDADGVFSVTGVYRAWGEPVRIEAPGARRVFDADKIKG